MHIAAPSACGLARRCLLAPLLRAHHSSRHPLSLKKTTSRPKASPPSSTAATSTTGPAAPRATRAKSPPSPADERAEWDAKMKKDINEHWHVDNGELVSDGKDPYPRHDHATTAISKCGSIGRSAQHGDSGIYLRGTPQVQIWDPIRQRSASGSAPTKAPAASGTTRSTKRIHSYSPTTPSASGTACTSAWSVRTSP